MKDIEIKRSVSKCVTNSVNGIVIQHLWRCLDIVKTKCGVPEDCISSVSMWVDAVNAGVLHILFSKQEMMFTVRTYAGKDGELSVWHMDDEEVMMLRFESEYQIGEY